jgi:NADPH:quinone reductase
MDSFIAMVLPLTAIITWEMLFDRLHVKHPTSQGGKIIRVIGGAGSVGSIVIEGF